MRGAGGGRPGAEHERRRVRSPALKFAALPGAGVAAGSRVRRAVGARVAFGGAQRTGHGGGGAVRRRRHPHAARLH